MNKIHKIQLKRNTSIDKQQKTKKSEKNSLNVINIRMKSKECVKKSRNYASKCMNNKTFDVQNKYSFEKSNHNPCQKK